LTLKTGKLENRSKALACSVTVAAYGGTK